MESMRFSFALVTSQNCQKRMRSTSCLFLHFLVSEKSFSLFENFTEFAFSILGSYPERGSTLMAALKENLNVSVRELFRNNAEDLRKDFSCWISQPLPKHLPFKYVIIELLFLIIFYYYFLLKC